MAYGMYKSFMKLKEAADFNGIGTITFYNAIHIGELKAYKPNKRDFILKVSEIEDWIMTMEAQVPGEGRPKLFWLNIFDPNV